ncbi:TPA: hypothetical protein OUD88_002868 [Enterobacter hormaechei]|nr:hypothetical protein [Enterobacter hormaechei]
MNIDMNPAMEMEINTSDLANMLMNGFEGEDLDPNPANGDINAEWGDLKLKVAAEDENGLYTYNEYDADEIAKDLFYNDDEDFNPEAANDLVQREVEELDDDMLFDVDGLEVDRGHIVKAVKAYQSIDKFEAAVTAHMSELEAVNDQINELQYMAYGQIDQTINYYQSILDNPRTDDTTYREAMNELRKAEAAKREISNEYSKSRQMMKAKEEQAQRLKGMAINQELVNKYSWNQSDFATVGEYMRSNGVVLDAKAVNAAMMQAILKAAKFDQRSSSVEVESKAKVAKALGRATHTAKAPNAEDADIERAKRNQARKKAEAGKLSQEEMFKFLMD